MAHDAEWWENEYRKALDRDALREADERMNREEYPDDIAGYMHPCETCFGTGIQRNGSYLQVCEDCDGAGIQAEHDEEPTHTGFFMNVDGIDAHVLGDPDMAPESRTAVENLIRAAVRYIDDQRPVVAWWAD